MSSQNTAHMLAKKPQVVRVVGNKSFTLPSKNTGAILIPSKAGNSASNFKVFQKIIRQPNVSVKPTATTSTFSEPLQLNVGLGGQLGSGSIQGSQYKIIVRKTNTITKPSGEPNYEAPNCEEPNNSTDPEEKRMDDDDDIFRYVTVLFTKLNKAKWKIFNRYNFYSLIL